MSGLVDISLGRLHEPDVALTSSTLPPSSEAEQKQDTVDQYEQDEREEQGTEESASAPDVISPKALLDRGSDVFKCLRDNKYGSTCCLSDFDVCAHISLSFSMFRLSGEDSYSNVYKRVSSACDDLILFLGS